MQLDMTTPFFVEKREVFGRGLKHLKQFHTINGSPCTCRILRFLAFTFKTLYNKIISVRLMPIYLFRLSILTKQLVNFNIFKQNILKYIWAEISLRNKKKKNFFYSLLKIKRSHHTDYTSNSNIKSFFHLDYRFGFNHLSYVCITIEQYLAIQCSSFTILFINSHIIVYIVTYLIN